MKNADKYSIMLYNDDVNNFESVIQALVTICNHNILQAEQCANLVHYKGECAIKEDISYDTAEQLVDQLVDQGLNANIGLYQS